MSTDRVTVRAPQREASLGRADFLYRGVVAGAVGLLAVLFAVFFGLIVAKAIPGFKYEGWAFLYEPDWNFPETFGAIQLILGTLVTTFLALLVAVPLGIGSAVAIAFVIPKSTKVVVSSFVGILASVPSIIFGIWGVFVIVHYSGWDVEPWLVSVFHGHWPASGAPRSEGILCGGVLLAAMILPIIVAVGTSVLEGVPEDTVEAAYALGGTKSRVIRKVILPRARAGLGGAILLGTARALGETIAIATVIAGPLGRELPLSLLSTGGTLASTIATSFAGFTEPGFEMLLCLAVALIVITLITGTLGRRIIARQELKFQ